MPSDAHFAVDMSPDVEPGQTLLVGLSSLGMAGVTAVDYVVRQLDSEEVGHVSPAELPAITPVADGLPRHHTRLYNLTDVDLTVLVGELFVPVSAARSFADCLLEWIGTNRIEEVAILNAVPYPHGPEQHQVYAVATEDYHGTRLDGTSIDGLPGGFLEGVPGELVSRSLGGQAPPTGVFLTPAHPPGPDAEAALRLLDAVEEVYDLAVDRDELESLSAEITRYYANLADQLAAREESERSAADREFAADRMYM